MLKKRHLHAKVMKVFKGGNHRGYFNMAKVRPGQPRKTLPTRTSESFLTSLMGKGNIGNDTWVSRWEEN